MSVLLLCVASAAWAKPQVVKGANGDTNEVIVAEAVFAPPAQPGADAAPALQGAIDAVSKAGGGTVFLPAGSYTIASRVTVREGVTLRGVPAAPVSRGTVLGLTADKGDEEAPAAFTVERGSGLVNLVFWYPDQRVPDPTPYPWTVKSASMPANDNQTISGCTFVNSWKAICIGPEGNELHTIRDTRITALKLGLSIDSVTDIGRLTRVRLTPCAWICSGLPNSPEPKALFAYLTSHDTVALDLGRSDWEYMRELSVSSAYRRGLVFRKGLRGTTNAVLADSHIAGSSNALEIAALNQVGFSAYDCTFTGGGHALLAAESFDAVAQFYGCGFGGGLAGEGSGVVSLQACSLGTNVVRMQRGQLLARQLSAESVRLGAEVVRARIIDERSKTPRVDHACANGDVMVGSPSPVSQEETGLLKPLRRACPRPQSDALFVVGDFGASETNADNTAAFQAALDAAGKSEGGGTVYVPAGLYRFRGDLAVPTGVELRGCFDVPHHTVSAGSVLMVYQNQGQEDGSPFVSLQARSGLRGLTFWYPEQPLKSPVPYPWTVRSLGEGCWLKDVTIGNAWQAVDFATHRSDGHFISYLAGSMYRRGLFVGNSKGGGFVEDVQFNPHYAARLPQRLPRVNGDRPGDAGGAIIQFQREHLEGLVFTDCRDERLCGTFLYAAYDGLSFKGKCQAQVLMHGTDTGSRAASFAMAGGSQVDFALAQLVSLGDWAKGAIVTLPENRGDVRFCNSQIWAGPATAVLEGRGTVRMEQFNTLSGPVEVRAGRAELVGGVFDRDLPAHVAFSASAKGEVRGTVYERGALRVEGDPARVRQAFNSASVRPAALPAAGTPTAFVTSFEPGEPESPADVVVKRGGGLRQVSAARCGAAERRDAHSGRRALLFQGVSDDPAYSFAYLVVSDRPFTVLPDTVLTYWHKPLTAQGRSTGVDLLFSDGRVLRESGLVDSEGRGVSPGARKGEVGQWTRLVVPLGKFAGQRIETVMAAYDTRKGGGRFEALFDDLRIEAPLPPESWRVRAEPPGGLVPPKGEVRIVAEPGVRVRYTLDGSAPGSNSPLYEGPLKLPKSGEVELRYTPLQPGGGLSACTFAERYRIGG